MELNNSQNNNSRKYSALLVIVLASLAIFGVVGLIVIVELQPTNILTSTPSHTSSPSDQAGVVVSPPKDEIIVTSTSTVEPQPTKADIQTNSTKIIAPLLSFSESIGNDEIHTYVFQAAADTPLQITLETNYELLLKMQISDQNNDIIYENEFSRGVHEITFDPDVSGEYRITIKAEKGQGNYTISMAFATKAGSQA